MQLTKASNLACPLDGAPLGAYGKTVRCSHGHAFDEARQGYLHLLPVQHKRSKEPGDSTAMVEARTRFLNAGLYRPISERLNRMALDALPEADHLCIVDAGCGEGYYLEQLCSALLEQNRATTASLIGLDIAKPAIIAATRRNKQISWLVASNRNPCLLPATVDLIICMFGFPDFAAFRRVLKPGGSLIMVDAGAEHLMELRRLIYSEVRKSPPPPLDKALQQGFALQEETQCSYHTEPLAQAQLADLLQMTPHLFRASREGKEAAANAESLSMTIDVVLRRLRAE